MVGAETARRLATGQAGMRLKPGKWASGEIPWIVDVIAPAGREAEMLEQVRAQAFPETTVRYAARAPESGRRIVRTIEAGVPLTKPAEVGA